MRRIGIAAICLCALAACSSASTGGGGAASAAPTPSRAPTTLPSMTVQQVASIVAQHRADLDSGIAALGNCAQASLAAADDSAFKSIPSATPTDVAGPLDLCEVALTRLSAASSLAAALDEATPPSEVKALATETSSAARSVASTAAAYSECLPEATQFFDSSRPSRFTDDDAVFNCSLQSDPSDDAAMLKTKLAGWAPYGG